MQNISTKSATMTQKINGNITKNDFMSQLQTLVGKQEERLNWDLYFMSVALLSSVRSSCHRLHVGCALVKDKRLISSGYNGYLAGAPHISIVRNNHEQNTVHAEQNAIADAAKRGVSVTGSTAYITHFPCINCAKILAASGIKEIKYLEDYKNDELVKNLFLQSGISIFKIH